MENQEIDYKLGRIQEQSKKKVEENEALAEDNTRLQ